MAGLEEPNGHTYHTDHTEPNGHQANLAVFVSAPPGEESGNGDQVSAPPSEEGENDDQLTALPARRTSLRMRRDELINRIYKLEAKLGDAKRTTGEEPPEFMEKIKKAKVGLKSVEAKLLAEGKDEGLSWHWERKSMSRSSSQTSMQCLSGASSGGSDPGSGR